MFTKAGPAVEVKITNEEKGEVQAVFSTMNVKDKDGDVTENGAFGDQNVRISAYNHQSWNSELPIGKGTISEQGNEAVLNGQFFLNTQKGHDTFVTIKELGELMEWSYGYDILDASPGSWPKDATDGNTEDVQFLKRVKVHEVSPVILGAGVDTRTLSAKSDSEYLKQQRLELMLKNLSLLDHVTIQAEEFDSIVTRIAEVVAMREEKGKNLSDPVNDMVKQMLSSSDRLREVLASGPTEENVVNTNLQQLAQSILRDSKSLLHLTGGYSAR